MAHSEPSQNKVMPSPFLNSTPQQSFAPVNKSSANEISLHGYRSNFNVNQQKQNYKQRHAQNQNNNQQFNTNNFQHQDNNRQRNQNRNGESNHESSGALDSNSNWCEKCERGFKFPNQLAKHVDEHEKCWFDNCNFEGHSKLLQNHIESQHQSGLFQRIGKVETDEDIEKWREERRKRYPTAANIEARRRAQEKRMKRGERIQEPNNRFGKMSDRRSAKFRPATEDNSRPFKQAVDKRKRNRGARNKNKNKRTETTQNDSKNGNDAAIEKPVDTPEVQETEEKANESKANALSALAGFYGSESEDDEGSDEVNRTEAKQDEANEPKMIVEDSQEKSANLKRTSEDTVSEMLAKQMKFEPKNVGTAEQSIMPMKEESDDEPPEEQPIQHTSEDKDDEAIDDCSGPTEIFKEKPKNPKPTPRRQTVLDMTRKIRNQNTLLEKLLQKDIRHERNVLLQCVRYVIDNKFFGIGRENGEK